MPTDRAQDTEAIRAALDDAQSLREVLEDERCECRDEHLAALARLVARLEAAGDAMEQATEVLARHTDATEPLSIVTEALVILDDARAALAAAAPGETTPDVLACPECGKPLQLGHDCLAGPAGAAPGETEQTP